MGVISGMVKIITNHLISHPIIVIPIMLMLIIAIPIIHPIPITSIHPISVIIHSTTPTPTPIAITVPITVITVITIIDYYYPTSTIPSHSYTSPPTN